MTGIITKSDIEEVARGWLEGLGENIIIRPTLISGELRATRRNATTEFVNRRFTENNNEYSHTPALYPENASETVC